jgi:hypothetical protein
MMGISRTYLFVTHGPPNVYGQAPSKVAQNQNPRLEKLKLGNYSSLGAASIEYIAHGEVRIKILA